MISNNKVKWVLTDQAIYEINEDNGYERFLFDLVEGIQIETSEEKGDHKSFSIKYKNN